MSRGTRPRCSPPAPRRPARGSGRRGRCPRRRPAGRRGLVAACRGQPSAVPAPAPQSTYRLQFRPGFGFADAAGIAGYLAALGVTHAYLSPILQAAPGSVHGYDVVDHSRLSGRPRRRGRVPRHGGLVPAARARRHRRHRAQPHGHRRSRVAQPPVLVGAAGRGRVGVRALVRHRLAGAGRAGAAADPGRAARRGPATCRWTTAARTGPCSAITSTCCRSARAPRTCRWPTWPLPSTTGWPDWRAAATELNWRRFFDITSLIAVRVEDEDVFAATHGLLLGLMAEGLIDGLRVDHPDGLADPRGYLDRLAKATGGAWVACEKILTGAEELPAGLEVRGHHRLRRARQDRRPVPRPGRGRRRSPPGTRSSPAETASFAAVAETAKREVARGSLGAEVRRLARLLARCGRPGAARAGRRRPAHGGGRTAHGVRRVPGVRGARGAAAGRPRPTVVAAAAAQANRRLPARLHPALAAVAALALGGAGKTRRVAR